MNWSRSILAAKVSLVTLFTLVSALAVAQDITIGVTTGARPRGESATCAASPSVANCLYYQDFEAGGGTNDCSAESPVMNSGGECAYTTAPAPLAGSQSANVNDLLSDESSFTSGDTIHGYFTFAHLTNNCTPSCDTDIDIFQHLDGAASAPPRIRFGSHAFPDLFQIRFYCDENFSGEGISYTALSTQIGGEVVYQLWWEFTQSTGVGQFWILGGSQCPTTSTTGCTQSCDGAASASSVDGFRMPLSGSPVNTYIIDNIIIDDVGTPNEP